MTKDRDRLHLGGAWVRPAGREVIEVVNPFTEKRLAEVPAANADDVDRAVAAARIALPAWSDSAPAARAAVLRKVRDGLAARTEDFARTITQEMGCPIRISRKIQAQLPVTVLDSYLRLLDSFAFEECIGNSLVTREPVGVVAAITPWNYPLHQVVCKLAPALAAGCSVVLKPSELTPLTSYLLFDVLHEAGLPPGVVNLVPGYGAEAGRTLAAHPGIDAVSFTGSTAAGVRVSEAAAPNITRVTLELGGKSANVVLPDGDLKAAVKVGVASAFLNAGQTCTAWTRLLVHRGDYAQAVDLAAEAAAGYVPADPSDEATKLGPLVSAAQRERVLGYVRSGIADGARVASGGASPPETEHGYFVSATVLADVGPDDRVAQEEIFGPVLCVLPYDDEEHAVELANNTDYGLAGGVWSGDPDRALRFARRMRTGAVDINGAAYNPLAPFGGYRHSGIGRELGRFGLEEFLEVKAIQQ